MSRHCTVLTKLDGPFAVTLVPQLCTAVADCGRKLRGGVGLTCRAISATWTASKLGYASHWCLLQGTELMLALGNNSTLDAGAGAMAGKAARTVSAERSWVPFMEPDKPSRQNYVCVSLAAGHHDGDCMPGAS